MSVMEIVFAGEKESPDWQTWKNVLPVMLEGITDENACQHVELLAKPASETMRIGVISNPSGDPDDFWDGFIRLVRVRCEWFINATGLSYPDRPWLELEPRWRGVCIERCFVATLRAEDIAAVVRRIVVLAVAKQQIQPEQWRAVADAKELMFLLPECRHGGELDLTNIMLAPARMICKAAGLQEEKTAAWSSWVEKSRTSRKAVQQALSQVNLESLSQRNLLAAELFQSWACITAWLSVDTPEMKDGHSPEVLAMERMMDLLTGIRSIGKGKPGSSVSNANLEGTLGTIQVGPADNEKRFRILVVDDHAHCWYGAINLAATLVAKQLNASISIDFSTDAQTVSGDRTVALEQALLRYDLVLLDVFLPGSANGTELLNQIRIDVNWLPVIVWTSSLSSELAGSAAMHNGYLFKKTGSIEELSGAFRVWLPIGSARRHYSLPNRFFNYTIQDVSYRKLAVDFHEWCLKQLDSFHALDGEYFRYFTDHGGRHIVKLWELLEQAIQPFLFNDEVPLFSNEPALRELEILSLYLAVACHELGMFPMLIDGKVEDFSSLGFDYLNDVRSLHAVRGMVLLHDKSRSPDGKRIGQFWNDGRGGELGAIIRKDEFKNLVDRLAVLVAYHARVFERLTEKAFLRWEYEENREGEKIILGARIDIQQKLAELKPPVPSWARGEHVFQNTYLALAETFNSDPAARDRLRRQCALFRFVDALDMTASRNPAEFLIDSGRPRAKQYGENLKRELCRSAKIEDGMVCVEMAVGAPSFNMVKAIVEYVYKNELMDEKDRPKAQIAWNFVNRNGNAENCVEFPWTPPGEENWRREMFQNSAMCLQKPFDCWLKKVWQILMKDVTDAFLVAHLKELEILVKDTQEPYLTFEGARHVASITTLSVAGEILDEYQAIVDTEQNEKIRLSPLGWGRRDEWTKEKIPSGLPTLAMVLAKHH